MHEPPDRSDERRGQDGPGEPDAKDGGKNDQAFASNMGIGIAIGVALGVALMRAMGPAGMGAGIAIGVALGVAFQEFRGKSDTDGDADRDDGEPPA